MMIFVELYRNVHDHLSAPASAQAGLGEVEALWGTLCCYWLHCLEENLGSIARMLPSMQPVCEQINEYTLVFDYSTVEERYRGQRSASWHGATTVDLSTARAKHESSATNVRTVICEDRSSPMYTRVQTCDAGLRQRCTD
jgi:hypothetical protein